MSQIAYQITIPQWLSLTIETRQRLKELFSIPRSSGSQVNDGVVVSDGHTHEDLKRVSIEAMVKYLNGVSVVKGDEGYLGEELGFYPLLELVLEKVIKEQNDLYQKAIDSLEEEKFQQDEANRKALLNTLGTLAGQAVELGALNEPKRRGRPAKVA